MDKSRQGLLFGKPYEQLDDMPPDREAEKERDKGMERIEENNKQWMKEALKLIPRIQQWHVTGEDIRQYVCLGLGPPTHHNAWGALVMQAIRRGLIEHTGRYAPMKSKKSHARKTPVYRVV